jgi:hypothetical protein
VITGTGGTATWRVTLTGALRHPLVSQLAGVAAGPEDAADAELAGAAGVGLAARAAPLGGLLVAHDVAAARVAVIRAAAGRNDFRP